ncbi:hypothetical protein B7C51_24750 (plasmid) [Paenibacillus larvae subsp. pulvifaciens]|uniref:Uncharacterized protein n=1 Tax=Paenibacillus larvae subsp. pulvifaciens TaxID=1477 RepID=A0A1V0UZV1_9BACL|nr:hypothetical protein [Paenibacillus larvae]ARF70686.1 hypothetical protein B7C51_24750 [Paenibacillus larvae subsp. pulvifaciens]
MKLGIIEFTEKFMGKKLFQYEKEFLKNYEKEMEFSNRQYQMKPSDRSRRHIENIWLSYQEYLSKNR